MSINNSRMEKQIVEHPCNGILYRKRAKTANNRRNETPRSSIKKKEPDSIHKISKAGEINCRVRGWDSGYLGSGK